MACWLYEGLLLFALLFIAVLAQGVLALLLPVLQSAQALQVLLFLVFGAYFTWFWSRSGQTLAMKTWHLRVVDTHGRPLTRVRALARYALCWLWFLPPLAAAAPFHLPAAENTVIVLGWVAVWALLSRFHPQRQFLHDVLAGTRLISTRP
ncbi:RDD family protein [Comamonas sp. GB3 AK4-5]|uniref:RDD family protein n=1 Tax=Comamonas sp. GB3 AK4-5 TaxID=3231487 RepID=UPI00351E164A